MNSEYTVDVTLPITYNNISYKVLISQVTYEGSIQTKAMGSYYPSLSGFSAACSGRGFNAYWFTIGY